MIDRIKIPLVGLLFALVVLSAVFYNNAQQMETRLHLTGCKQTNLVVHDELHVHRIYECDPGYVDEQLYY